MPAAYDNFDYPAYWEGRNYEHESELVALKAFLERIPKIGKVADIGGGYGRLVPYYRYRVKSIDLVDPSKKLLKIAKENLADGVGLKTKIKYIQASIDKLGEKKRRNSYDLIVMVRVMHHVKDPEKTMGIIEKLLKPSGYLILEFPNKVHSKALLSNFLRGNFTYLLDIFPSDKRCKKNIKKKTLPFLNYHPDTIYQGLKERGFEIIEKRSVSNIRVPVCKRFFPLGGLVWLESKLQKGLVKFSFGPSIFLLAKKSKS